MRFVRTLTSTRSLAQNRDEEGRRVRMYIDGGAMEGTSPGRSDERARGRSGSGRGRRLPAVQRETQSGFRCGCERSRLVQGSGVHPLDFEGLSHEVVHTGLAPGPRIFDHRTTARRAPHLPEVRLQVVPRKVMAGREVARVGRGQRRGIVAPLLVGCQGGWRERYAPASEISAATNTTASTRMNPQKIMPTSIRTIRSARLLPAPGGAR